MKNPSTLKAAIGIALLVVVVAIVWMASSGRMTVSLKGGAIDTKNKVCSSELIAEYNTAFSAESQEQYIQRLSDAVGKVGELKDTDSDPNCVYIQYTHYVEQEDIERAKERLTRLKSLAEQGVYMTGELANPRGLVSMEQALTTLEALKDGPSDTSQSDDVGGEG